uniref:Uncharacterized protein n=1 Tax=Eptatretus burgeri TaxID=7764 RepID=A0A8C4WUP1_EPTBU
MSPLSSCMTLHTLSSPARCCTPFLLLCDTVSPFFSCATLHPLSSPARRCAPSLLLCDAAPTYHLHHHHCLPFFQPLSAPEFARIPSSGNLVDMVTKQGLGSGVGVMCRPHTATAPIMAPLACTAALPALLCSAAAMGRSHSSGNLSDQLLQPIQHGGIVHLMEPWYQHGLLKMTGSRGSSPDSLGSDKPGHTAMTGGRPIFTVGSPPRSPTPPRGRTFTGEH